MKSRHVILLAFSLVAFIVLTRADDDDDDDHDEEEDDFKIPWYDKKAKKDCKKAQRKVKKPECCLGKNCKPGYYCAKYMCHSYYPKKWYKGHYGAFDGLHKD